MQFFATVAHDLRNPLGAAHTSAALIARDPHAAGVAGWAARIIDNIGRADRMVRDLLDAMRVQPVPASRLKSLRAISWKSFAGVSTTFMRRQATASCWWPLTRCADTLRRMLLDGQWRTSQATP